MLSEGKRTPAVKGNPARGDPCRLAGRETETSPRHPAVPGAVVCARLRLFERVSLVPLGAGKQSEDGSATDHQPPGQPLETDSQFMEITQTNTRGVFEVVVRFYIIQMLRNEGWQRGICYCKLFPYLLFRYSKRSSERREAGKC